MYQLIQTVLADDFAERVLSMETETPEEPLAETSTTLEL